jgi:GcrA cell cycle regulator
MSKLRGIWTEEKVSKLETLRAKGYSFRKCAIVMHLTRSAIAGKCHRLGLTKPIRSRSALVETPIAVFVPPVSPQPHRPWQPKPLPTSKRELYEDLAQAVRNTK